MGTEKNILIWLRSRPKRSLYQPLFYPNIATVPEMSVVNSSGMDLIVINRLTQQDSLRNTEVTSGLWNTEEAITYPAETTIQSRQYYSSRLLQQKHLGTSNSALTGESHASSSSFTSSVWQE